MKGFVEYITDELTTILAEAGGAEAGKLELLSTNLNVARSYAKKMFEKGGQDFEKQMPNFDKNYTLAQKSARLGFAKRKDMPVIDNRDVRLLQKRLSSGSIDINKPFAKNELPDDPYPQGLNKKTGDVWVSSGLAKSDGDPKDDVVKVSSQSIAVGNLKPIQAQIYFDKSIKKVSQDGVEKSRNFLTSKNNNFVVSKDNRIIDGHHRFLTTVLIDPKIKVNCMKIDLPIKELLPLTLAYTDAIGNVRNEESNPRIPRKKGQPANSKKHSDLYTDENPKDTIHGLGFKDVATAEASIKKIENSGRSHAHKIQAAVAMEQRAREMGKTSEAAVYRKYIDKMKKKTKEKNK